jgi:hypothetical protein
MSTKHLEDTMLIDPSGWGAHPNNMAPPKYRGEQDPKTTVLQQGIDSIWLNVYGELREDVLECLAMAKEQAVANGKEALSPLPPFDGTTPLMRVAGRSHYEWVATSPDIDVQIRKPSARSPRPMAVIRVSSEALWRLGDGGKRASKLAAEWLRPLFTDAYRVTISHAHVCTDYQGYVPVIADLENVVGRASDDPHIEDTENRHDAIHRSRSRRLTGLSSGRSTNLRLNMYDKVLEIGVSGKTWLYDLWARTAGYQAGEPVWRIEHQFGRTFLHERGIETLDALFAATGALWEYAMGWYTFRQPNGADSNRSRWPIAAWWQSLSTWAPQDAGELPKVKVVRPKLLRLMAGFVGYLTSCMALIEQDSPEATLHAALDMLDRRDTRLLGRQLAMKRQHYAGFTMASA